jgi:hypothetical protein
MPVTSALKTPNPPFSIHDDIDSFSNGPSGGRFKQWFAGVFLALLPIGYGIHALKVGRTVLLGNRSAADLTGPPGVFLAAAYIAIGFFIHFHYFWGLHPRLCDYAEHSKALSLIVFAPCFLYAIYGHLFR